MNKLRSITFYFRATELVTDNTELVILSQEPATQTVVLQSAAEGDVSAAQQDDNGVVVSLLSCTFIFFG